MHTPAETTSEAYWIYASTTHDKIKETVMNALLRNYCGVDTIDPQTYGYKTYAYKPWKNKERNVFW